MSFTSAVVAELPVREPPGRFSAAVKAWFASYAEHRRAMLVGRALLRSGDREMMELGRQILGGRPVAEVFGDS